MKILYVDDIRIPKVWQKDNNEIVICRTYAEAIKQVNNNYDVIDLDHDLGEVKTGYDFCKYIVENNIVAPFIVLHTSNPVGRNNMRQLLERYTQSKIILM